MTPVVAILTKGPSTKLPKGVVYDHTDLDIVDAAGAKSSQVLSADQTSASFDVADGVATITVTDRDDQGNAIGMPVQSSIDTNAGFHFFSPTASVSLALQ